MEQQTFNWTIAQLERTSDSGFVVTVHWRYSLTEDVFFTETYSVLSFTQESEDFIPFEDITEADVIGWLESSMDMEAIQESLQLQIEQQKNPPILTGFPWKSEANENLESEANENLESEANSYGIGFK